MIGDPYKRIERVPGSGVYQCGCRSVEMRIGESIVYGVSECPFHAFITEARHERQRHRRERSHG